MQYEERIRQELMRATGASKGLTPEQYREEVDDNLGWAIKYDEGALYFYLQEQKWHFEYLGNCKSTFCEIDPMAQMGSQIVQVLKAFVDSSFVHCAA